MALLLRLLRELGLAFVGSALLGLYVTRGIGALGDGRLGALASAFGWPMLVEYAVMAGCAWFYTRTFRRALVRAAELTPAEAVKAAISAHRLPIRVGLTALAVTMAGTLLVLSPTFAAGQAPDLAAVGVAVGLAIAVLVGMLGYSTASSKVAREIEGLGKEAETGLRGSVHGKILVSSLGLFFIALLLVGATSYAQYRVE